MQKQLKNSGSNMLNISGNRVITSHGIIKHMSNIMGCKSIRISKWKYNMFTHHHHHIPKPHTNHTQTPNNYYSTRSVCSPPLGNGSTSPVVHPNSSTYISSSSTSPLGMGSVMIPNHQIMGQIQNNIIWMHQNGIMAVIGSIA